MDAKQKAEAVINLLKKEYSNARISLRHKTPMQLLAAVILSAQCTDKRVNIVTQQLFKKYKTPEDFAKAEQKTLEQEIKSTGFYRNKAKNIIASARLITEKFSGGIPDKMGELLTLPGVARKTANIILSSLYGKNEGIAVDTHMKRVNYRLGLTKNTNPDKIERDLMDVIPHEMWGKYTHLIIAHGRATCKAPVPLCSKCILNKICLKQGVVKRL